MTEGSTEHTKKMKLGDVFTKLLLLLIIVMLAGLMYLNLYPPTLSEQRKVQAMVQQIAKQDKDISAKEYPQFAVVTDPDALRKQNQIMADIYKDAQKDDYVFGFSNKMIIYRDKENKIVYQGPSPQQLLLSQQQQILDKLTTRLKAQQIIADDSKEVPQLAVISDTAALKNADPSMYGSAKVGDITAVYPQAQLFVLYRPSTDEVINHGKVSTTFQPAGQATTPLTTPKPVATEKPTATPVASTEPTPTPATP